MLTLPRLALAAFALLAAAPAAWAGEAPQAPPPAPATMVVDSCAPPCAPPCAPACREACCSACLPKCGRLTLDLHVALLDDPEGPPTGIAPGTPTAVDWDSLSYGLAIGGHAAYEWKAGCDWVARVGGTWWGNWSDDEVVNGNLAGRNPNGGLSVSPLFDVPLESEATLWEAEVSLWRTCTTTPCWCAAWGWGLRYVSFEEESSFSFPAGTAALSTALTETEASNTLLAAQLLGRVGWCLNSRWDFTIEAAGFAGWRHTETDVVPTWPAPSPPATHEEADEFGFGFAAELALRWKVCPSWSIRGGYGMIALFDQARSTELVEFGVLSPGAPITSTTASEDTVLVHRLFLGVEFNF